MTLCYSNLSHIQNSEEDNEEEEEEETQHKMFAYRSMTRHDTIQTISAFVNSFDSRHSCGEAYDGTHDDANSWFASEKQAMMEKGQSWQKFVSFRRNWKSFPSRCESHGGVTCVEAYAVNRMKRF